MGRYSLEESSGTMSRAYRCSYQLISMVMLTLGRRVPDLIRRELREIGEDLQKQFEEHGYEIMSDHQREQLKPPPRGPDGWTADEILAWEQYRLQMMLKRSL
jgi:hypothetical protein